MDNAGFPAESPAPTATNVEDHVEYRYAENEVRNHYTALGEVPCSSNASWLPGLLGSKV